MSIQLRKNVIRLILSVLILFIINSCSLLNKPKDKKQTEEVLIEIFKSNNKLLYHVNIDSLTIQKKDSLSKRNFTFNYKNKKTIISTPFIETFEYPYPKYMPIEIDTIYQLSKNLIYCRFDILGFTHAIKFDLELNFNENRIENYKNVYYSGLGSREVSYSKRFFKDSVFLDPFEIDKLCDRYSIKEDYVYRDSLFMGIPIGDTQKNKLILSHHITNRISSLRELKYTIESLIDDGEPILILRKNENIRVNNPFERIFIEGEFIKK